MSKIRVTDEAIVGLREIYKEFSGIELYDPVTNEKKYESIEDLKNHKRQVIERYMSEYFELAETGVPIGKLPDLIENF